MLRRKVPAFQPPGRTPGPADEKLAFRTQPPSPAARPAHRLTKSEGQTKIDVNRLVWDPEYRDEVRRRLKVCG